jgi:proteic killer suppression protein
MNLMGAQTQIAQPFRTNYNEVTTPRSKPDMEIEFANSDLARLETDADFNAGFGEPVVRGYRKVIRFIRAAEDERDFRSMRSLHFEKLKGNRSHQHSFRLNNQWRLIVEVRKTQPKNSIFVVEIVDYH